MEHTQHVPVLLHEVITYLQPRAGGQYIDGTLGGGGHTRAILEQSAPDGRVLGIDTDAHAIERVQAHLSQYIDEGRLILAHGNFSEMRHIAENAGFRNVQGVLLDLGFSSDQMNDADRGFSFSADGPLDMRLDASDTSLAPSAADLVNTMSEQALADILWRYGEERRSRQIASRIVQEREKHAITRTAQLATLVAAGVPRKPGTIHPATRTFQALRIAVNGELERLETVLPDILDLLFVPHVSQEKEEKGDSAMSDPVVEHGGRMAIISFHSLEDRIVKEFMRREASDCICPPRIPVCICGHKARLKLLTHKPVIASEREVEQNLRARSAKLRVAEAISVMA